jgi:hypothetical protein
VAGERAKERQQNYNNRNRAKNSFELDRGQLWRQATATEPRRLVLCMEDLFEHIAEVHFELEHAALKKTYGLVAERYYGPVREDVEFLIARCIMRLVRIKLNYALKVLTLRTQ